MTSRLRSRLLLLGVVVALAPGTISAGSYKWVDEKGNVTYSDRPPQGEGSQATAPEPVPLDLKTLECSPEDRRMRLRLAVGARADRGVDVETVVFDEIIEVAAGVRDQA